MKSLHLEDTKASKATCTVHHAWCSWLAEYRSMTKFVALSRVRAKFVRIILVITIMNFKFTSCLFDHIP